jgi:hypothetical protein
LDGTLAEHGEVAVETWELLRTLAGLRAKRGRPHWFLIDEIQNFCPPGGGDLTDLILQICQAGGIGLISFQPSQVAPAVLESVDH